MKTKKQTLFQGQEWWHAAGKAPFSGLNNTLTSIPAWAEVHYWDTNLLTSSVEKKKTNQQIREKPRIIVSIPISQQEFQGHGFIYMGWPQNFILFFVQENFTEDR